MSRPRRALYTSFIATVSIGEVLADRGSADSDEHHSIYHPVETKVLGISDATNGDHNDCTSNQDISSSHVDPDLRAFPFRGVDLKLRL